jgi:hypothetical protein
MKDVLCSGGLVSSGNALFLGSTLPYLLSWTMYKGNLLLSVLNWAGLVINGSVAFLLPVILVALSHHYRRIYKSDNTVSPTQLLTAASLKGYGATQATEEASAPRDGHSPLDDSDTPGPDDETPLTDTRVRSDGTRLRRSMALPRPLQPYIEHIAVFIIVAFLTIIVLTVWVDVEQGMQS